MDSKITRQTQIPFQRKIGINKARNGVSNKIKTGINKDKLGMNSKIGIKPLKRLQLPNNIKEMDPQD